jgi:putative phage-type endonuclease
VKRVAPLRIPVVPGSPEWRALRRTGVGASEIPIITGDSRFGDLASLYQDKLGYAADLVESPSMEAGHWLEDIVARWYAEKTGHKVRRLNALLRNRERPWMIATPDRVQPGRGLLEVKVTDAPGERWGRPGTDEVPDDVREQVQWQAAVAGVEVVDVAVFFTRTRRRERYTVGRDQTLIDELIEYGAAFWHSVQTRTPPEPVGRSPRALLRGDEIEADDELAAMVDLSLSLRAVVANAEADQKQVDDAIRTRLDAVGGARGEGFRVHYRPQKDREVVAWQKVAHEYDRIIALISKHRRGNADIGPEQIDEALDRWRSGRIETDLTSIRPGPRPLVITTPRASKEITSAA